MCPEVCLNFLFQLQIKFLLHVSVLGWECSSVDIFSPKILLFDQVVQKTPLMATYWLRFHVIAFMYCALGLRFLQSWIILRLTSTGAPQVLEMTVLLLGFSLKTKLKICFNDY